MFEFELTEVFASGCLREHEVDCVGSMAYHCDIWQLTDSAVLYYESADGRGIAVKKAEQHVTMWINLCLTPFSFF